MDTITIGQVLQFLVGAAGGITTTGIVGKCLANWFHRVLQSELRPIKEELDEVKHQQNESALDQAQNFIVLFLARVERGEKFDSDELRTFAENYDRYKGFGGNPYIHAKAEKLKQQGKLS